MLCDTIIAIVKGKNFVIEKVIKSLDEEKVPYKNVFDLAYYANVKATISDTLVCIETTEASLATKTLNKIDGVLVMPTGLK